MGGQHDGDAAGVQLLHPLPKLAAQLDVDAGGGLVEDQHRRLVHHGLGHHQAALHAAGQLAHIGVGLVGQAQAGQDLVGLPVGLLHAVEAGLHLQRLARGEEHVADDLLRHHADGRAGGAGVLVDVDVPDLHLARGLVHQPGQDVDEGGLARPVRAQQAEHGAARNGQVDALQRRLGRHHPIGRIGLDQTAGFDGVVWDAHDARTCPKACSI